MPTRLADGFGPKEPTLSRPKPGTHPKIWVPRFPVMGNSAYLIRHSAIFGGDAKEEGTHRVKSLPFHSGTQITRCQALPAPTRPPSPTRGGMLHSIVKARCLPAGRIIVDIVWPLCYGARTLVGCKPHRLFRNPASLLPLIAQEVLRSTASRVG
jgi:hypothetical protein